MVELKDIAKKIENILNTNSLGKTCRIFSDSGELAKRNGHENEYRNGLVEIVSSTISNLSGLQFINMSVNLTLYANEEIRGKDSDGNSIEIIELRQILGDFLDSYNFKTFAEEFGEATYSTTYVIGATTTLPKGSLGYINDCVPLVTNIGLTFFENGVNSNEWQIFIDGEEVGYTSAVISRTKTAENQPLAESKSTKSVMQTNGFGLDLVVPQISNNLGKAIENEILTGQEYAHMLYIKGKNTEQNYVCVFGNLQASLIKNSNVGFNVPLVEGVPELLEYEGYKWLELEVEVTDLSYNTVTILNNDSENLHIIWGDEHTTYSNFVEIQHTYSALGTYTVILYNNNATDSDWADAVIRDYLALDKFTYTVDNKEITITKVNAPATTYEINGTYYIDNEVNTVTEIGDGSNAIDSNAVNVTLNNGIESIKNFAFTNVSSLTNITIPDSVYNIGGNSFSGTSWYTSQSDGVVYAGKVAYTYKGAMPSGTEIVLNSDTLGIAETAFDNRGNLKSITIPDSVVYIGNSFVFRSKLENIYVGSNNLNYSSDNFSLMSSDGKILYAYSIGASQTTYSIPSGITEINKFAFYESKITSITIPNSVTEIGNSAFRNCTNLTTINVGATVPPILGSYVFHIGNYPSTILTQINVPSASLNAYKTASGWSAYADKMVGV